jgi:hypothetical protein
MQAGIARTIRVLAVFGDPTHRAIIHHPTLLRLTSTRSKWRARIKSSLASIARQKDGGETGTRQGHEEEAPERSMTDPSTIRMTLLRM